MPDEIVDMSNVYFDVLNSVADTVRECVERVRAAHPGKLVVGAFKSGGHGDFLTLLAFCKALKRRWGDDAVVVCVGSLTGTALDFDLETGVDWCHVCRIQVDHVLRTMDAIRRNFDVFYDIHPYVVKTYVHSPDCVGLQARADNSLARFAYFYSVGHFGNPLIEELGLSQWELLSMSSGVDVRPSDLHVSTKVRDLPDDAPDFMKRTAGIGNWEKARLHGIDKYVTVHNCAGRGGALKECSPETFDAIVGALYKKGFRSVQIGGPNDSRIQGSVDRRGLRIGLTARLIQDAQFHVGIESSPVYVAKAVGTPSVVLFGPTPTRIFGFAGNLNVTNDSVCRPCWWSGGWPAACARGYERCERLLTADEIVLVVEHACKHFQLHRKGANVALEETRDPVRPGLGKTGHPAGGGAAVSPCEEACHES